MYYLRLLPCCLMLFFCASLWAGAEIKTPKTWPTVAESICQTITHSMQLYHDKKDTEAFLTANRAYFEQYDAKMEPTARSYLGNRAAFSLEQQFRDFSAALANATDHQTKQEKALNQQAKLLCKNLQEQAAQLLAAKAPLPAK